MFDGAGGNINMYALIHLIHCVDLFRELLIGQLHKNMWPLRTSNQTITLYLVYHYFTSILHSEWLPKILKLMSCCL